MATCVACMLGLAAVACATASARPPEPGAKRIRKVHIAGNRYVSDQSLIRGLETHPPRGYIRLEYAWLDDYAVEQDRARIETYYRSRGYFSARVTDVDVIPVARNRVDVRFMVDEGAPSMLDEVNIRGAPDQPGLDPDALRSLIDLTVGEPFHHGRYMRARKRLSQHFARRGYAFVTVRGRVLAYPHEHRVVVELDITPGPLARFGPTTVVGLRNIPESVVLNRLAWERGERFDPTRIDVTTSRLHALGMFSTVRIDLADDQPGEVVEMRVAVTEAPKREIRAGVGAGVDPELWEVRGRAGYAILGLIDPLTRLSLEARPAYASIRGVDTGSGFVAEASATVRREDLLLPRLSASARAIYSLEEAEAYVARGPTVRVGFDRPLADERIRLGVGWRFRYLRLIDVNGIIAGAPATARALGLIEGGTYRLGVFEQSLAYDRRDRPLEPRRGYYAALRLQQSGAYAGSAFGYGLASLEVRGFVPLGRRVTLGARVRGAAALWGSVPITERLYGGGATGHRGFGQRGLSPVVTGTTPGAVAGIGGEAQFEATLEARIDLFQVRDQWMAAAVFTDAGDVTETPATLDLTDPYVAVGGGLRYRTVLGAVRFDVGYRINRLGPDDLSPGDRIAYHLTLGEAF